MIRLRPKEVKFRLAGGLGNQVLQYFGAMYIREKLSISVKLDLTEIDTSHTDGRYDLRSFLEPNNNFVFEDFSKKKVTLFFRKFFRKLRFYWPISIFVKILFEDKDKIQNLLLDVSNNVGWLHKTEVQGWFGNFEYFFSLPETTRSLSIKNPSERFRNYNSMLEGTDYVAIHLRLGDYFTNSDRLGVLSKEYYSDALKRLNVSYDKDFIVIFSNDSFMISDFIDLRIIHRYLIVESDPGFDPAEVLILMSRASKLVIANSTFSYTAALLSSQDAEVAFPRFNKQGEVYILNPPSRWVEIKPKWI
jgi:hypothetical protein